MKEAAKVAYRIGEDALSVEMIQHSNGAFEAAKYIQALRRQIRRS